MNDNCIHVLLERLKGDRIRENKVLLVDAYGKFRKKHSKTVVDLVCDLQRSIMDNRGTELCEYCSDLFDNYTNPTTPCEGGMCDRVMPYYYEKLQEEIDESSTT